MKVNCQTTFKGSIDVNTLFKTTCLRTLLLVSVRCFQPFFFPFITVIIADRILLRKIKREKFEYMKNMNDFLGTNLYYRIILKSIC